MDYPLFTYCIYIQRYVLKAYFKCTTINWLYLKIFTPPPLPPSCNIQKHEMPCMFCLSCRLHMHKCDYNPSNNDVKES